MTDFLERETQGTPPFQPGESNLFLGDLSWAFLSSKIHHKF